MKKKKILSILLSSLIILTISSCDKKDDDNPVVIPDTLELLTDIDWVEHNISYFETGHDETDKYSLIFGDLTIQFNGNGTYFINSQNLGILTEGTWVINEDQTLLTLTDTNSTIFNITIVTISNTSLGLQFIYVYNNGLININVSIEGTFIAAV